jgi:hypothetical protein
MSDPIALPPDDVTDGWDDVEEMVLAKDEPMMAERDRCAAIVSGEIERGRLRGIPDTSGVMVILHRIYAAISNA